MPPTKLPDKALRLHPLPAREISVQRIYEDLELPPALERSDPSRPYVVINMVSSVDGRSTVEGKAARLGSETDRRVMRTLRSKADAVMIGANTLRAEKLSLGLDEAQGAAAPPQPLALILSNTGDDVPLESHLIRHDRQEVLVLVPNSLPEDAVGRLRSRTSYSVVLAPAAPRGSIDLPEAFKILKAEYSVDLLLAEGGPTLNHALISQNLADELFLTLAPVLLGGSPNHALTILKGPPLPQDPQRDPPLAKLLCVHLAGDELFLRYAIAP